MKFKIKRIKGIYYLSLLKGNNIIKLSFKSLNELNKYLKENIWLEYTLLN